MSFARVSAILRAFRQCMNYVDSAPINSPKINVGTNLAQDPGCGQPWVHGTVSRKQRTIAGQLADWSVVRSETHLFHRPTSSANPWGPACGAANCRGESDTPSATGTMTETLTTIRIYNYNQKQLQTFFCNQPNIFPYQIKNK